MPGLATALPFLYRHIFHPTDFTQASQTAFVHALKLALVLQTRLSIMHVDPDVAQEHFEDFPRVRPILARWGLLPNDSSKESVTSLGIEIKKIRAVGDNPVQAFLHHLAFHPADLLVLSTEQRTGLDRWLHRPVAEPIARGAHLPTLFVPSHVEGCVSTEDGSTKLRRILIPVESSESAQRAIDAATVTAEALGSMALDMQLVHVGGNQMPAFRLHERNGWTWHQTHCQGNVVDWIIGMGAEYDVDLIVMTTEGHHSWTDALRGSTTERVVREARCPVMAVPST
ncbi:MAG: universal stress protein [Nitrospiraceae bacterium]